MEGALIVLLVVGIVLAIGAGLEQGTRRRHEIHEDDQMGEGNTRW